MGRRIAAGLAGFLTVLLGAAPAWACGGLLAPDGNVNLLRTTTLAAYHDGIEHYVTSFEFAGGGGRFGSLIPLPDVPSRVQKGGDWTLQRLIRETQPQPLQRAVAFASGEAADASAKVILETRIDALDITILEGGGDAVGRWARANGFLLPPAAPEVLDFYAARSPIFMAARFDIDRARERGIELGDGTPVHLTIPTESPWVPLRILGLGKLAEERIEADVYLLTDRRPSLLPSPAETNTMTLAADRQASDFLLADLRSDRGMRWLPRSEMWLTYLEIDASAGDLVHDLAIDPSGDGTPSAIAAGLLPPFREPPAGPGSGSPAGWQWALAAALGVALWTSTAHFLARRP